MVGSFYGMTNYNNAFVSPLKSYEVNPAVNLIYGAVASKMYSQTVAKKLQSGISSYLSSLNQTVSNIKSTAKPLIDKGTFSSYDLKTVTSSDASAITGTADAGAAKQSYTLKIAKLATAQVNEGQSLKEGTPSPFTLGVNSFSIKNNTKDHKISFTVQENESAKSSLQKMATAINGAKANVTASVVSDKKTGTSFLRLASSKTGEDKAFTLQDLSGNAVAASFITTTKQQAQDATYTLDGQAYTSDSNTIDLEDSKVDITFSKAENKDITLHVDTDREGIQSDIQNFIDGYNKAIKLTQNHASQFTGASRLRDELSSVIEGRRYSLEHAGIELKSDGTLSIDAKKLDLMIKNNPSGIKELLSGQNGVASKVYSKANEVISSPLRYATPNGLGNKNSTQMLLSSMKANAQSMTSGMLFDMLL